MSNYSSFDDLLKKAQTLKEGAEPIIKTRDMIQGPNGKNNHKPVTIADVRGEGPYTTNAQDPIPMLPYPLDTADKPIVDILMNMEDLNSKLMTAHANPSLSQKHKAQVAEAVKKLAIAAKEIRAIVDCIGQLDNVKY